MNINKLINKNLNYFFVICNKSLCKPIVTFVVSLVSLIKREEKKKNEQPLKIL